MNPTPSNPTLIDSINTFYNYVMARAQQLNPQQVFHGVVDTQDWPQTQLDVNGGLYLVLVSSIPVPELSRPAQEFYEHFVQWNWVWMGADIQPGQIAANRGSRFQSNWATFELLRQAHFPGFCEKSFITYDSTAASGTFTPYSPIEMVRWTTPKLQTQRQQQAGILYGSATLQISAYSTVNPAMNP